MICRFILVLWIAIYTLPATAQLLPGKELPRPRLVVGIVVDQMRWDYLYRFYNRYSEDGFKRLLREGFSCDNTYINYLPTVTAIGHSSIYTGSVPAIHGIAGNSFIIQETGESMYCTEDNSVVTVGTTGKAGRMSPRNLLSSTITDELKLATNFQSKVIGIALKDRGSILPAGHFANAAYWLDEQTGNWISSSYYMKQLPEWVAQFNEKRMVEKYLKNDWHTLYPLSTYHQSLSDNNKYEEAFEGGSTVSFPIPTSSLVASLGPGLVKTTPFGNTLTLDMAKAAIRNERLGQNPAGFTDFLAISLSSIDAIGHQFAVNSPKIEDALLRLDKDLGNFLKFLDQQLGKGKYTVFLTADHGAAHNPQFFTDEKGNGGFFNADSVKTNLNTMLQKQFGERKIVISLSNYQVHLNNKIIKERALDEYAIKKMIVQYLKKVDGVAFVVDMDQAAGAAIPALIRERIVNGYNSKNCGVIQIILEPQMFNGPKFTGTSHGNWNPYDSHIPLIWMGWGIKTGRSTRSYNMTDIAPTVAALLYIQEPNGNIGNPITEVLKN